MLFTNIKKKNHHTFREVLTIRLKGLLPRFAMVLLQTFAFVLD